MNEVEAFEKIDEIDRQLFALNNRRSLLEYKLTLGDIKAAGEIDDLYEAIRRLLENPSLLAITCFCRERDMPDNLEMSRKAVLLEREIRFSAIENSGSLRQVREVIRLRARELDQDYLKATFIVASVHERSMRREALGRIATVSAKMEPSCREWSSVANKVAREAGYGGYAQAKLAYEAMTVGEIYSLFRQWRDMRLPQWRNLMRAATRELGDMVKAHDLLYLQRRCISRIQDVFEVGNTTYFLRELLSRLGAKLEELPVSIESRDIPFRGSCYRVMPGKDVRILLDSSLTGFPKYFFLLHEFGHAIYYCHCPVGSELLIDAHPARETMADLWAAFLKNKSLLQDVMGFSSELADEVIRVLNEWEVFRLFIFMREAIFTFEVLRNPSATFANVWRAVSNEWLGIDDDSEAFDFYDFVHPLDMKNYVLAQVLSESTLASLASVSSLEVVTHKLLASMVSRLYKPGHMVEWRVKLEL